MEKTCFVVCPIGSEGSEVRKRSNKLLKHILQPVCSEIGLKCIRVDELNLSDTITQTILENLKNADLVIADITDHNPNAFYEIGYRTALDKPIIHLKNKSDNIPFDISAIRTFDYDLTDLDMVDELKNRLIQTIRTFHFDEDLSSCGPIQSNENFNVQILNELYTIQDQIKELSNCINHSEATAISILADKLAINSVKTPETAMAEAVGEMIKNPDSLKILTEISAALQK